MIRRLLSVVVFSVPLMGMALAQEAPKARASDAAAAAMLPRDPRAV